MTDPARRYSLVLFAIVFALSGIPSRTLYAQQADAKTSDLAAHLVETAGISRGLCAVLSWHDDALIQHTAEASEFLVHGWTPDRERVAAARKSVDAAGLYGARAVIEVGTLNQLPYAENTLDVILATSLSSDKLENLNPAEVLRVLRPLGKAILGQAKSSGDLSVAQLEAWLKTAKI